MRHCPACNIDFTGPLARCPLCQSALSGQASPSPFPEQNRYLRPRRLAAAIVLFACGVGMLLLVFLGTLFAMPIDMLVASCITLAVAWLVTNNAIVHAPDPLRVLCRLLLVLPLVALIWFVATRQAVVPEFVMPIVSLVALAFDVVLWMVLRRRFVERYAKYALMTIVLALLPWAMTWFGLVPWDLLARISALCAAVVLLALMIFAGRALSAESRRLFAA